ncbi:MAG: DNA repair protein RecO [Microvirgula sp.]
MSSPGKVTRQPAYVLHAMPYKETSLLVEVLTRDYGRLGLVARGARRPRAAIRGVLLPFAPLEIGWFGKGEVKTLADADWLGGVPQLGGGRLMAGFYLNELLLKLLAREDPHETVYADYAATVGELAAADARLAPALRRFELRLIAALGYAPQLDTDRDGQPLDPEAEYGFVAGEGACLDGDAGCRISGATLLALAVETFSDPRVLREARQLNRHLLGHILGETELATRLLLNEVTALGD